MRLIRFILILLLLAGSPVAGLCGGIKTATEGERQAQSGSPIQEEQELSAYAVPLWDIPNVPLIGHFPITNSMLVTWIVALGVIIFAQIATRNMKPVPEGAQNFWEWMV